MLPRQARRQEVMANRAEARRINAQPGIAAQRQAQMMQGTPTPTPRPGAGLAPVQMMGQGQPMIPTAGPDAGMRAQPGQQLPGMANNPYDREALDRYIQYLQLYAPGGNNV